MHLSFILMLDGFLLYILLRYIATNVSTLIAIYMYISGNTLITKHALYHQNYNSYQWEE